MPFFYFNKDLNFCFVGAIIYFAYGVNHSTEEMKMRARVLEPVDNLYASSDSVSNFGSYADGVTINASDSPRLKHEKSSEALDDKMIEA